MTEILGQFREDDLPPSGVDVQRAVRVGRRRRRARTGVVAASVVAALTLGAATAPRWLGAMPGPGSVSPGGTITCEGGAPLPSEAPANPTAPAYLDVLRHWVDVEEVSGFQLSRYTTSRYYQVVELTTPTGDRTVEVTLYAADGEPHYRTGDGAPEPLDPAAGTPIDPVDGQTPAYWLPEQEFTGMHPATGLAWEWAPGAWVFVTAANTARVEGVATPAGGPLSDVDRASLRAAATEVAGELRLGPHYPVTSPFLMQVPDCTRLLGTALMYSTRADGKPFSRFDLLFGSEGTIESTNPLLFPGGGEQGITVNATSGATPNDKPGSATLTVDGHPAHYSSLLVVYGVDGFSIEISAPGDFDAAVALYRSVYVYPGAKDSVGLWSDPVVS